MYISSSGPDNISSIVGWVQDPNGRGTSGLILSCVATLGLCVWSALHLNIPKNRETRLQWWIRNVRWIFLGILVPELVVLAAWRQWTSARELRHALEQVFDDSHLASPRKHSKDLETSSSTSQESRRFRWTLTHCYYAGMGGLAFEIDQDEGLLLHISEEELKDKSKADGLTKAVVLLQAGWFFAQTIGRLAVKLPVTLLEVNTLAHAFCAGMIFLLWWRKLRGVNEPTILRGDWTSPLAAYMYMSSRISDNHVQSWFIPRSWYKAELQDLVYVEPTPLEQEEGHFRRQLRRKSSKYTGGLKRWLGFDIVDSVQMPTISPGMDLTTDGGVALKAVVCPSSTLLSLGGLSVSAATNRRQHLAALAVQQYQPIRDRFHIGDNSALHARHLTPVIEQLVIGSAGNWPSDALMGRLSGQLMGMVLWCASMVYGVINVSAWNEYFPTPAEQFLWRFSAAYIACSGGFWFIGNVVGFLIPGAVKYYQRAEGMNVHWIQLTLIGFSVVVCGLTYVLSRLYLAVEAIISLREMPAAVYSTPNWSDAVPHL